LSGLKGWLMSGASTVPRSDASPTNRPAAANAPTRTLRGRLVFLAVVILVPATLAGAALLFKEYRDARAAAEQQLSTTAQAIALALDRQFGQDRVLLQALAQSPSLATGDYRAFDEQARAALASLDGWIVVIDDGGKQYVNTREPWGADL